MLRITLMISSGFPDPSWVLEGKEAEHMVAKLAQHQNALSSPDAGVDRLGYRGLRVDVLSEWWVEHYQLPASFELANGASENERIGFELAEELIDCMLLNREMMISSQEIPFIHFNAGTQQMALTQLKNGIPAVQSSKDAVLVLDGTSPEPSNDVAVQSCQYRPIWFNPGYWNQEPYIWQNNCYNYASGQHRPSFSFPGAASGRFPRGGVYERDAFIWACEGDGARPVGHCFDGYSADPVSMVALFTIPQDKTYFHFARVVRHQQYGFCWGHKGGTGRARVHDDANFPNPGNVIYDPRDATIGGYEFVAWMYFPWDIRLDSI